MDELDNIKKLFSNQLYSMNGTVYLDREHVKWLIEQAEKVEKYERVLNFYADKNNYEVFGNKENGEYEYIHIVDMDEGDKARKALNI